MLETRSSRIFALGVLLLTLFVAFVGYGILTSQPQSGRYPGTENVAQHTDDNLGEDVVVSGTVVNTDPVVIRAEDTHVRAGQLVRTTFRITITNVTKTPSRGATMQVYGTLTDRRTVRAINTIFVPAGNYLYMYVISFLAGLCVLLRILQHWRLDWRHVRVVPRSTPLTVRTALTSQLPTSEEDNTDA